MDRNQSREYREFLLKFSNLKDTGYKSESGAPKPCYTNYIREAFRNETGKKSAYITYTDDDGRNRNVYRPSVPSLDKFQKHCNNGKSDTLYMINSLGFDTLMVMIDFDMNSKLPDEIRHDPDHRRLSGLENQALAEQIAHEYFNDMVYIEPSTNGAGRHMYLFFDLRYANKSDFKVFLWEFVTKYLRNKYSGFQYAKIDRPMGLPTFWGIENGKHKIVTRGNLMKIPYLSGDGGLDRLKALSDSPINFSQWSKAIVDYRTVQDSPRNSLDAVSRIPEVKTDVLPVLEPTNGLKQENSKCMAGKLPLPANKGLQSGERTFFQSAGSALLRSGIEKIVSMESQDSIEPVWTENTDFTGLDGKARKDKLIPLLLRQYNGKIELDRVMTIYHDSGLATGMSPEDIRIRREKMRERLDYWLKTFNPDSHSSVTVGITIPNYIGTKVQKSKEYAYFDNLDLSPKNIEKWENRLKEIIPESELNERGKCKDKVTYKHLSIFFICKITASFQDKDNTDMFGCSSRNVFLKGLRELKSNRIIDLGFNNSTHKFIFDLFVRFKVFDLRQMHVVGWKLNGQTVKQGRARRICIGESVDPILRQIWINRYETMIQDNEIYDAG